jgi:hypothetical protein
VDFSLSLLVFAVSSNFFKRSTKMLNVNEMKREVVGQMWEDNNNIGKLIECLSALDRLSHSGAYDLNDQIATMEKLREKMYEVIERSSAIIGE